MAETSMTTANALRVQLWESKTYYQALRTTCVGRMVKRGSVYFPEKFKNTNEQNKGDKITFPYVGKLTNVPRGEGQVAYGFEEALDTQSHSMEMNESRVPVLNPNTGTIEQQRTHIDFDEATNSVLSDRIGELLDASAFQQLAGASPETLSVDGTTYNNAADKLHVTGHNAVVAPTTNRIIRAGSRANDQTLTSADKMSLPLVDYAIELAQRTTQPIKMLTGNTFDLYLAPEQQTDLKHDASSAIQWFNIQLAKIQAGADNKIEDSIENDIYVMGMYNQTNIIVAPRVAGGVSSADNSAVANTRRAVMVGRDALAFGSPYGGGKPTDNGRPPVMYTEELIDYGHKKGRCANLLYGAKKMSPSNKEDIGVIVISTYAAAHT
jgi:hypothetical protein